MHLSLVPFLHKTTYKTTVFLAIVCFLPAMFGYQVMGQKQPLPKTPSSIVTKTPGKVILAPNTSMPVLPTYTGGSQVEIINADSTVVLMDGGIERYKLIGNVGLRQGSSTMYCREAFLNRATNTVDAMGNVKIIQADTVTITGEKAFYNGNTRRANILNNVVLNDNTIKLTCTRLDYDLNTHVAYYNSGGKIVDKQSTLTSKEGFYDTVTKIFMFYKDVNIVDKESTVTTDSLKYSTLSKEAIFIAPTVIKTKSDTLLVRKGTYNTATKISNLYGRSSAVTQDYILTADTLFYDTPTEIGILRGNAQIFSKKDSVILNGNYGKYIGKLGLSFMTQKALMRSIQKKDTLYLTADTLQSIEDPISKQRKLLANKKVKLWRKDLQASCDSLSYSMADSAINFFVKPIIWANGSQSQGDTITLQLINNQVRQSLLKSKAFVILKDTLGNFNQVKGRQIVSFLNKKSGIDRVQVNGNGESIYFALDEKNTTIGMNRVKCGRMNINFKNNQVKRIAFITKPEARLIPPFEIKPDEKELDGFAWRDPEKPTREQIVGNKRKNTTTEKVFAKNTEPIKPLKEKKSNTKQPFTKKKR
jgi:lipopolysaccharide export system protein LptA